MEMNVDRHISEQDMYHLDTQENFQKETWLAFTLLDPHPPLELKNKSKQQLLSTDVFECVAKDLWEQN